MCIMNDPFWQKNKLIISIGMNPFHSLILSHLASLMQMLIYYWTDKQISPGEICSLQIPNPWLDKTIVENIEEWNITCFIIRFVTKRICIGKTTDSPSIQKKRTAIPGHIRTHNKSKRVRLGIDKEHPINGQTKSNTLKQIK